MNACTIDTAYMKAGMKLVRAAVSGKGQVLAPAGAALTTQIINAILDADIRSVTIVDDPALKLPPDARLDDALTQSVSGSTISTPDEWLSAVRELFVSCVREKKIDEGAVRNLGAFCLDRLKTENPYSLLLRNEPASTYVFHHAFNTSVLSLSVGQSFNLPEPDLTDLFAACLFHDIGMTQVTEHMWLAAKPLTKMFREEIEKHTGMGSRTLERASGVKPSWIACALDHHERLDGSGYPGKKTAASLPAAVRIVSVCDVYAAMIMPRAWRAPVPADKAIKELIAKSQQFDRGVVGRLVQRVGIFPVASKIKLSDGSLGVVSEHRPADPLHPVIQAIRGGRVQKIDLAKEPTLSIVEILSSAPSAPAGS